MNKWLETDPNFSSEDISFRRLVVTVVTIVGALVLIAVIFNLVSSPQNRIVLAIADGILLIALVLALRGILTPARMLTPSVLFITLLLVNVFGDGNGIYDTVMIGLAGTVILAGLLLGPRGALVFGILIAGTIFLMGVLDAAGIYTPKRPTTATVSDVGTIILVAIANSAMVYQLVKRLTEIARRARTNEELQIASNRELRELQATLEERIHERTRDLERRSIEFETVAQVARDIASVRDLNALLTLAAKLIQERFGYYHVGIFIIDERHEYAVLRAASSVAAKTMLERHHKLRVGEVGLVGYVASTGLPRIALDVGADAVHFKNPLLPETRSEIALPLKSRRLTMGVLNIQAVEASAFDQKNIETLQLLADQLVSAIENAQLVEQSDTTLRELNAIYQSQTRRAWQSTVEERGITALEYDGLQVRPIPPSLPAAALEQLESGKPVVLTKSSSLNVGQAGLRSNTLILPLTVLNQVIGVIGMEQDDPDHVWTPEELAIAEAAASRAGIALENARLLQDAQSRAALERQIGDISSKIGSLVDLDNIIQTTIQELGRNMPEAQIAIQFHNQDGWLQG